jgi:hypothetical protein
VTVYTRPISTAQRLLTKYGATAVLTRTVSGDYDPDTGTTGADTVTTYTGVAFREQYSLREIDGTLVKRGDVRLIIGPKQADGTVMPVPATTTDTVLFDGTTYLVVGSDPFKPADESVLLYVQARGV